MRRHNKKGFKVSSYIGKHPALYAGYCIASLAFLAMSLYIPQHINKTFDAVVLSGITKLLSFDILGLFIIIVTAELCLSMVVNYLNVFLSNKIAFEIEFDTLNHIKHASYKETQKYNDASLAQRINNDSVCISDYAVEKVSLFVSDILLILLIIPFTCYMSTLIGIFLLVILALFYTVYFVSRKIYYKRNLDMLEAQNNFFGMLSNQIFNLLTIKLNSFYEATDSEFLKVVSKFFITSVRFLKIDFSLTAITQFLTRMAYGVSIFLIGVDVLQDNMTVGSIATILLYVQLLLSSAQRLTGFGKNYQAYKVSKDRTNEIYSIPLDQNGSVKLAGIDKISVQDLSFSIGGKQLFKKLSFVFRKGNIYLIRGANGTGKSTLLNVILGILPRDSGEITFNAADINDVDMESLRLRHIAFTEQVPCIYNGTVYENITYGMETGIDEDRLSNMPLLSFSRRLSNGLFTQTGGHRSILSGGEKQKIAISRSLIKNSDVLIFDEPTSALDSQSIEAFVNELQRLRNNHIIILISHDERIFKVPDKILSL